MQRLYTNRRKTLILILFSFLISTHIYAQSNKNNFELFSGVGIVSGLSVGARASITDKLYLGGSFGSLSVLPIPLDKDINYSLGVLYYPITNSNFIISIEYFVQNRTSLHQFTDKLSLDIGFIKANIHSLYFWYKAGIYFEKGRPWRNYDLLIYPNVSIGLGYNF